MFRVLVLWIIEVADFFSLCNRRPNEILQISRNVFDRHALATILLVVHDIPRTISNEMDLIQTDLFNLRDRLAENVFNVNQIPIILTFVD